MSDRDLDMEIAEKVMGWKRSALAWGSEMIPPDDDSVLRAVPFYSYDMTAAWEVVEATKLLTAIVDDSGVDASGFDGGLTLSQTLSGAWEIRYRFGLAVVRAKTAPLAICYAALKRASIADTATEASGENAPGPNTSSSLIPATGHHEETGP